MKYVPLTKELFEAGNDFIIKIFRYSPSPDLFQLINGNRIDKYICGHKTNNLLINIAEIHVEEITETGFKGWTAAINKYPEIEFEYDSFLAIVE